MSVLEQTNTPLGKLVSDLGPCSPAHREYHDLKAAARWGRTARTLIIIGVVYNAFLLAFLVYFLRHR